MFCNTKSFLLKESALVMDKAREFWVSPHLDVNERLSSLAGLGGSAFPVPTNLLISSSINSGMSGVGEGVGSGCSGVILSEELLRRRL